MSRTHNSVKNMLVSVIGQILVLITHFVGRTVFIQILGVEYLGVNGVFTNVLSMLSLAELGVGTAITYALYKPLAENNDEKVHTIMSLFKKIYIFIGIIIGIVGLCLIPFLDMLVQRTANIDDLSLIYILFLANTVSTYFFSYNQSLLIADQKIYLVKIYSNFINIILTIIQIVILIYTSSYILYLVATIISTFITNIVIRDKCLKRFTFLKSKEKPQPLSKEEKTDLKKNIVAMSAHKVGGVVVFGTSNIIIAGFLSVALVGIYSNYMLVITTLTTLIALIYTSVSASVGNLGVVSTVDKNKEVFNNIYFFSTTMAGYSSVCLIVLFNPFIEIWIGKEFLLEAPVVIAIVVSFYTRTARSAVSITKDAFGLFWKDRYKPLFEAVFNLIISIILVNYLGITGVILGSIISFMLTTFWVEPYVLYKYSLGKGLQEYFTKYIFRTTINIIICVVTVLVAQFIPGEGIYKFSLQLLLCVTVVPAMYIAIYYRTKEFKYYIRVFNMIRKKI